jgi:hypothetical protein
MSAPKSDPTPGPDRVKPFDSNNIGFSGRKISLPLPRQLQKAKPLSHTREAIRGIIAKHLTGNDVAKVIAQV